MQASGCLLDLTETTDRLRDLPDLDYLLDLTETTDCLSDLPEN